MSGFVRRLAICRAALGVAVVLALSMLASFAEARNLALVVGNNAYQNVHRLETAVNDAEAVGDALETMGFVVRRAVDANRGEMIRALTAFEASLQPGDRALFFYSGHGFEISGANYLLPTDVPAAEAGQENLLRDSAIAVESVIDDIRARGAGVTILVLDACRDNPFAVPGKRGVGGVGGLARIDAPSGVFVLMSAGAKQEALDKLVVGEREAHSVFTRILLRELGRPGKTLVQIAKATQIGVTKLAATVGYEQTPAYYDQVVGDVVLSGDAAEPAPPDAKLAAGPPPAPSETLAGLSPDRKLAGRLKLGGAAPIASFLRSNAGWRATLSLPEPAIAIAYRLGEAGEFIPTGLSDTLDERTGQRRPNPSFPLPFNAAATTIQVRYQTPDGGSVGPFAIRFDPETALFQQQKQTLEQLRFNWAEFREFQGEMIYLTTLIAYRCAIAEVRFGLNGAKPLQRYDLPACDARDPFAIPETAKPFFKVPATTQSITLQITWKDGTQSPATTIERQ